MIDKDKTFLSERHRQRMTSLRSLRAKHSPELNRLVDRITSNAEHGVGTVPVGSLKPLCDKLAEGERQAFKGMLAERRKILHALADGGHVLKTDRKHVRALEELDTLESYIDEAGATK